MQDLDLDELDQAVNKMMDKSSRGKRPARSDSSAFVPSRPEPVRSDATPVVSGEPESEKATEESPATPPSRPQESLHVSVNRPMPRVPERRRMHPGAMDIIQPSTSPKVTAPSSRPGRMAADLQPTQDIKPEPVVAAPSPQVSSSADELTFKDDLPSGAAYQQSSPQKTEKTFDSPQDVSDEVLASLSLLDEQKPAQNMLAPEPKDVAPVVTPEAPKKSDGWPDPLDFHDFGDKPAATADPVEVPKDEPLVAPEAPADELKETPPSMDTEPVSVTDTHDDAANLNSSPFVTTKVEKRPLGAFADAAHEPPKAVLPEPDAHVPHESTSKEEMASASFESKSHVTPEEHDPTDLRSMTIPPQYHQSEQKPHEDIRDMYDTKEYHAAPQHMHTAHKSSPALIIGVVVLIVLIIAAVAVGYLMMTGAFDVSTLW
jgi:hypothetical protein